MIARELGIIPKNISYTSIIRFMWVNKVNHGDYYYVLVTAYNIRVVLLLLLFMLQSDHDKRTNHRFGIT